MRDINDGLQDAKLRLVDDHVVHKAAVDLESVDLQALQAAKARICPEIIKGEAHAELVQLVEHGGGFSRHRRQQLVRDLKVEPVRAQPGSQERSADAPRQLLFPELAVGDIDGDGRF